MPETKLLKYYIAIGLPEIKQPPRAATHARLLQWARALPDKDKVMVRRMLTCLNLHNYIKKDNKLTYALWTKRDRDGSRIRSRNRRIFLKLGLVKKHDGSHIHHIDGNIYNNHRSNLQVVNGRAHKHAHNSHVADAVCARFLRHLRTLKRRPRIRKQ